ncbi:hypothetical protein DWQ72_04270 [Salmonella enterica]|nr:hypothetical protein [Salmonella enterica]ECE5792336.1 hypothetical protein [Salmonella enterica subsp. diarizonae]EBJ5712373.1 hypothetical protein [Salmonella enterica]ECE6622608.1 hypothetical protein [Salmonella enterica subsp. diarizonae]ECI3668595.1 hypothetical protein [Salmonella enterica subsp. diarizonae]
MMQLLILMAILIPPGMAYLISVLIVFLMMMARQLREPGIEMMVVMMFRFRIKNLLLILIRINQILNRMHQILNLRFLM